MHWVVLTSVAPRNARDEGADVEAMKRLQRMAKLPFQVVKLLPELLPMSIRKRKKPQKLLRAKKKWKFEKNTQILSWYILLHTFIFNMVSWSSWLWHLLNTQNVPSSILGEIKLFFFVSGAFYWQFISHIPIFSMISQKWTSVLPMST